MSNFLERLKNEQKELQLNLDKLNSFTNSDKITELSTANRILLRRQAEVMKEYNEILIVRLELND